MELRKDYKDRLILKVLSTLKKDSVVDLVSVTEKKALKKSRLTGIPTPAHLEKVKKISFKENVHTSMTYEKLVRKMQFREKSFVNKILHVFSEKFEADKTYAHPITDNHVVFEHGKTKKRYIRMYLFDDVTTLNKYYDMDGKDVTDQWKELQAEYFSKPSPNKSQSLENPFIVNNLTITNIKYLRLQGKGEGTVLLNDLSKAVHDKLFS